MKTFSGSGLWALFLLAAGPAPEYDEFAELRRQIRESAQWDRDRLARREGTPQESPPSHPVTQGGPPVKPKFYSIT